MRSIILFLFLFLFTVSVLAQQGNLPLNDQWMTESEAEMVKSKGFRFPTPLLGYETDTLLHVLITNQDSLKPMEEPAVVAWPTQTSFRPIIEQGHGLRHYYNRHNRTPRRFEHYRQEGFLASVGRYHRSNSLLQVEKPASGEIPLFRLYIDPLLNLQYMSSMSSDTSSETLYTNSRGITARGDIGTKVSFETSFWENQAFLPSFQDSFALKYGVIPGMGRWKKFKSTGYDYAMASGMISWSPCRNFNMQVGHGKHFIGDGIRSLLLSDNSFNYPYARFTGWFGPNRNMQYTVMYASMMNLTDGGVTTPVGTERLFQKKSAVFHHFSWRFLRTFEISIFEGAIFEHADSSNRQHLSFAYFDPIPFAGVAQYGLNDTNNYMLGATFRADLFRTVTLYGQFVMDDIGSGVRAKTGFQIGARYFNAFTLKHLHLRIEYNKVNDYAYAHSDPLQSWTHYNQALAHPLGAGFSEINGSLFYKYRDVFLFVNGFYATSTVDYPGIQNNGQDIFKSDTIPAGFAYSSTIVSFDAHIGWMISYASNFNLSVGYKMRKVDASRNPRQDSFVYVALRTSLTNTSFDFF